MSKSLKNMVNQDAQKKAAESFQKESQLSASELIEQYGGKTENELKQLLSSVISDQKREGIFDHARAEAIANSIMPLLNEEQSEKFDEILKMLE